MLESWNIAYNVLLFVAFNLIGTSKQSHNISKAQALSAESIGDFSSSTLTYAVNVTFFTTRFRSEEPLHYEETNPQVFHVILSGTVNNSIGLLQVKQKACAVQPSNASFASLFSRFVITCRYERMTNAPGHVFEANLTIFNPTIQLNRNRIVFQPTPPGSHQAMVSNRQFTIRYCDPQLFKKDHLELNPGSKLPIGQRGLTFNAVVHLQCTVGLLFSVESQGAASRLVTGPASKTCGVQGEWIGPNLHCWQGQSVTLPYNHHVIDLVDQPTVFLCKNTNASIYDKVVLKIGNNMKAESTEQVASLNVTLQVARAKNPVIVVCEEHATNGEVKFHKLTGHVSQYNITHAVHLGSHDVINFPISSRVIVNGKHVRVFKDGMPFKAFRVVHRRHQSRKQAIEVDFLPVVKESDLGDYVITITLPRQGRTITKLLHVVEFQHSVSRSTVAGVAAGVVVSLLVVIIIVAVVLWRMRRGGRLVRSSSMEHVLEYQDDQDDVFYPAPSANQNEPIETEPTEEYQGTSFTTPPRAKADGNGYLMPSQLKEGTLRDVPQEGTHEILPTADATAPYVNTMIGMTSRKGQYVNVENRTQA